MVSKTQSLMTSMKTFITALFRSKSYTLIPQPTVSLTPMATSRLLQLPQELKAEISQYLLPTDSIVDIRGTSPSWHLTSCGHFGRSSHDHDPCYCEEISRGRCECVFQELQPCCGKIDLNLLQVSKAFRADLLRYLFCHNTLRMENDQFQLIGESLQLQAILQHANSVMLFGKFQRDRLGRLRAGLDRNIRQVMNAMPNATKMHVQCIVSALDVIYQSRRDEKSLLRFAWLLSGGSYEDQKFTLTVFPLLFTALTKDMSDYASELESRCEEKFMETSAHKNCHVLMWLRGWIYQILDISRKPATKDVERQLMRALSGEDEDSEDDD